MMGSNNLANSKKSSLFIPKFLRKQLSVTLGPSIGATKCQFFLQKKPTKIFFFNVSFVVLCISFSSVKYFSCVVNMIKLSFKSKGINLRCHFEYLNEKTLCVVTIAMNLQVASLWKFQYFQMPILRGQPNMMELLLQK